MDVGAYMPHTVDEIFCDFKGRRNGMIKALTVDVDEFYRRCDPDKDNLSLYGYPEGTWEVNLPAEEIPPELPEPVLGINFAREGMERRDWLSLVAVHSDAWLIAVASFYSAQLDKHDRKRLFNMIGDPPTVFHEVSGRKVSKEKGMESNGANKTKSNIKMSKQSVKPAAPPKEEKSDQEGHEDEDEEEQGETFCGCCGGLYTGNELWIGCDLCERWFHAKCVKITPARAEHIKQYKCPTCSSGSGSGSNKRSHS